MNSEILFYFNLMDSTFASGVYDTQTHNTFSVSINFGSKKMQPREQAEMSLTARFNGGKKTYGVKGLRFLCQNNL